MGPLNESDNSSKVVIRKKRNGKEVKKIGGWAFHSCSQLDEVYYLGTIDQWNSISIEIGNGNLIGVNRYYCRETQPNDSDNLYWHYIDGVPTKW